MYQSSIIAGRYEINRLLGEGGGGKTFLAWDRERNHHPIALKLLSTESVPEAIRDAFLRECRLLARLDHPLIARLLDSGTNQGSLYYTSEYVEGGNIIAETKRRDWNAVFLIVVQAAWALQYLHDCGVIHGDIKPANLLVGKIHRLDQKDLHERATIKIIDFGLAKVLKSERKGMTGSLATMAPEVVAGKEFDHRADLYAFGIILYEIAWGKLPHEHRGSFAKYLERLKGEEIDLSPLTKGDVPRGIIELISRLTKKDPSLRPEQADEMIAILNKAEGEKFPLEFSEKILWREMPQIMKTKGKAALPAENDPAKVIHRLIEQGSFDEAERWLKRAGLSPLERQLLGVQFAYRQGHYEAAERTLTMIDAKLLSDATDAQRTRYESSRAFLLQARKKWTEAADSFERAAGFAEKSGRKDHEASLLANAGGLYLDQGNWTKAFEDLTKALDLARSLGDEGFTATVANNLGNLYLYFGRWTEASDLLMESLEIARTREMKPLAVSNLCLLTVSEEGRGNSERVNLYLDQVLGLAEDLQGAQPVLQAYLAKGYSELARNNFDGCVRTIDEIRRRAVGDPYYLLQAKWLEAKRKIAQGEIDGPEIDRALREVEEDGRNRNALISLWQVAADRGDLANVREQSKAARIAYEESLAILEKLRDRVPLPFQESFFRDRKKEKIRASLAGLAEFDRSPEPLQPPKKMDFVFHKEREKKETPMQTVEPLTFQRWNAVSRRLLQQRNLESLLDEILDAAIGISDAERGFLIHSDSQELEVKSARNFSREDLEEENARFSRTIARDVLRKGEAVVLFDAVQDERFSRAASVHEVGIRSVLCVPLRSGTRPVGLIYLDNRLRAGIFREDHVPILQEMADQASLVLEHLRLHRENREKIADLQKARETIERLNLKLQKDLNETTASLEAAREGMKRQNEEIALRYAYDQIIGRSPPMLEVLRTIDRIVDTDMNVFIHGESGTGKELIARALHFNSRRKDRPFLAENCSALPETLIESELFGHVRGAFTGADKDRAGLFEQADGGTLFLDEVGDMPPTMQAKLLRVLQEGEIRRVGAKDYKKVNVRVVSASNKDLKVLVAEGKFRQDLFYRMYVGRIRLPTLRERREDIPLLIDHFLDKKTRISSEALKVLTDYDWPGNVRELENEITRASLFGGEITPDLLSPEIQQRVLQLRGSPLGRGLDVMVAELEKRAIAEAMDKAGGNKVKASNILKIGRRTLYMKLEEYGIGGKPRRRRASFR